MAVENNAALWQPIDTIPTTELVNGLGDPARVPSSDLDKDAFLKLLIAQMKYQDPMNPMDDKEFLGQMAQFTSLEQMQNLNAQFSKTQAYSMIGKTVYAYYQDEGTGEYNEVTGQVSAVTIKNGEAFVYVDGNDIPIDSVSIVGSDYIAEDQLDAINQGVTNARDMDFVGKYVQALQIDGDKVIGYVEGKVDYVKFSGSQAILVIGDKEVYPSEVTSVAETSGQFLIGKQINAKGSYYVTDANGKNVTKREDAYGEKTVTGVSIRNNKAYLDVDCVVDGSTVKGFVPIEMINYVMEALQFEGKELTLGTHKGKTVDSVTVKSDGIPYFNFGGNPGVDEELSYVDYRKQESAA